MKFKYLYIIILILALTSIVSAQPIVKIGIDKTDGQAPFTINVFDASGDKTITQWQWDFGDETEIVKEKSASHIYEKEGMYKLTLTVTGEKGEIAYDSIAITVKTPDVKSETLSADMVVSADKSSVQIASTGETQFISSGVSVSSQIIVDSKEFLPSEVLQLDKELELKDSEISVKYAYSSDQLKETITINRDIPLKFKVTLSPGSKLIPWGAGDWKVISSSSDGKLGIVIVKPFGIDAKGNYVDMTYVYSNGELILTYDKVAKSFNKTLTSQLNQKASDGIELVTVKQYDTVPITYPLAIDPTYHYNNAWVTVGIPTSFYGSLPDLTVYNDGTGEALFSDPLRGFL